MRTLTIILTITLALLASGCDTSDHQREDKRTQDAVQSRLQQDVPVPEITGAAAREAVSAHIERWQQADVVSYVTLFSDVGTPIGYYTAQGKVASTCQMMSAPDRVDSHNDVVRSSPALDGTYYGDNVDCGIFFFTADSDAYVEWNGTYLVTDQPLPIDVEPLEVSSNN